MSSSSSSHFEDQQQVEIIFRMEDGSNIGPETFHLSSTIANVKETMFVLWPRERENGPTKPEELMLIMEGRILENYHIVRNCRKTGDSPGPTFMHILVRQPSSLKKLRNGTSSSTTHNDGCVCLIM